MKRTKLTKKRITINLNHPFLKRTIDIIDKYLEEEGFGVKELCRELGVSRSKLHRKLNKLTGKSTSQFIREFRLERALEILKEDKFTAAEIAYKVGFSSPTYFSSSFKKYFGVSPVEAESIEACQLEINEQITKNHSFDRHSKKYRILLLLILTVLFMLLTFSITYTYNESFNAWDQENTMTGKKATNTISILPFEMHSEEMEDDDFVQGFKYALQSQLHRIPELTVISSRSAERFEDSSMALSKIAKELGAHYLLEVIITNHKDSRSIIVKLWNAPENILMEPMIFEKDYDQIIYVAAKIASKVAEEMNLSTDPSESDLIQKTLTENMEAYNLFIIGEKTSGIYSKQEQLKAIDYYNKSLELDPEFALPYAGLAESYRILSLKDEGEQHEKIDQIKQLALKSIEIEDNSKAHIVLGALALTKEYKWEEAEKEYKLAIAVNPNNLNAYLYYADFLLHVKNDLEASKEQLNQFEILDPHSIWNSFFLTKYYFFHKDYEEAWRQFEKASSINPDLGKTNELGFYILVKLERFKEAIAALENLMRSNELYKDKVKEIGPIFDSEGIEGIFRFLISNEFHIETLVSNKKLSLAAYHAYLGENSKAIELLRSLIDSRVHCAYVIPTNPFFEDLHTEPEFIQLMTQIGLEDILISDLKS